MYSCIKINSHSSADEIHLYGKVIMVTARYYIESPVCTRPLGQLTAVEEVIYELAAISSGLKA